MREKPVKIYYETTPERIDALRQRLKLVGTAMAVYTIRGKMYLEVTINDDIFQPSRTEKEA